MYARIAAFEGGNEDEMKRRTEEAMSSGTMDTPEGMKSGLVLADREHGRRLFISFFDSADAIKAAEAQFEKMGDTFPEDVRGRRTSVDVYEVVWQGDV
jgi:hypothetical protein